MSNQLDSPYGNGVNFKLVMAAITQFKRASYDALIQFHNEGVVTCVDANAILEQARGIDTQLSSFHSSFGGLSKRLDAIDMSRPLSVLAAISLHFASMRFKLAQHEWEQSRIVESS